MGAQKDNSISSALPRSCLSGQTGKKVGEGYLLLFVLLDSSSIKLGPGIINKTRDHVNFVYNKCDLERSLGILAGKILRWSYGKLDILCHNFHINQRVM